MRAKTLSDLMSFMGGTGTVGGGGSLLAQIDELQRSVPEAALPNSNPHTTQTGTSAVTSPAQAQPSGILSLITELFSLKGNPTTALQSSVSSALLNLSTPSTGTA